ncbi:hypothetical protein HMPREF0591_1321, partial [Mycobacterium parascrofulaceum ATCC BAA-614]
MVSANCTARSAVPLPPPPRSEAPDCSPGPPFSPPPRLRLPISDAGIPDAKPL